MNVESQETNTLNFLDLDRYDKYTIDIKELIL